MEEKKIIIKFHKGITYEIPAVIIAESRANYYACIVDGYDSDSQEYLDEVNHALNDEFELFDWIENNMNWNDLKPYAIKIKEDSIDLENEWDSGNHEISVNW
jgi:hypothetical protein